ncbi:MAG: hypothetical protein CR988_06045 [Treponema sp.]|nr:MAG: hypothetical protein CR988_06045 [Treponema sp.]
MKKVFVAVGLFIFISSLIYGQADDNNTQDSKKRTIIINSAYNTDYKKLKRNIKEKNTENKDEEKDEIIIFTGNVSISVKDDSSTSIITADKILYNKTRNTMQAIGNVHYERIVSNKTAESFSGESMLFDVKKMSGVFLDGIIKSDTQKKDQAPYVIHAPIAARDESGTVAFKKGKLTTNTDEDPLWSIQASRIWLLPGNEMGFANGFFSIGVVPIFYIPFFYYPSDEMIFHPVFGYRAREGYFVQTTSYIFGRKPLAKQNNKTTFSNFLQADTLKKQERHGLFFKNLDEDAANQNPNYLKLIADAYSGLGYLIGVDSKFFPNSQYIETIEFNTYFGFSKTLYPMKNLFKNKYSTIGTTGIAKHEKSNLFGKTVPFRYSSNFEMAMQKNPFRLTIAFPFISDPFFANDFLQRSEDMNWFKFMLNSEESSQTSSNTEQSSYIWSINGSITPSTEILSPWLKTFSISNISTIINFHSKNNQTLSMPDRSYSAERKFYYPHTVNPKINITAAGTIFSTEMINSKETENTSEQNIEKDILKKIENPFKVKGKIQNKKKEKTKKNQNNNFYDELIPKYTEKFPDLDIQPVNYSLDYNISTVFLHEGLYDNSQWQEPKNINWKKFLSHFTKTQYDISLKSNLSVYKGFLQINNSIKFNHNYQRHPFVKDKTKKASLQLNNFKLSLYRLTNTNSVKLSPFLNNPIFNATYIQWTLSQTVLKNKFNGTYNNPTWEILKTKWDKEFITTHSLLTNIGFNLNTYKQNISFNSSLPPLLEAYSIQGNFTHPYGNITAKTRIFEREKANKKWFWEPFSVSLNWNLPYEIKMSQQYSYNIEEKESELLHLNISWKYISAFYKMKREQTFILNAISGWQKKSNDKSFIPMSVGINFSNQSDPWQIYSWKNRIKFSFALSSKLYFNLQKITESYFTFKPTLTLKIHEFLDLKISTVSRNDVIARYFQDTLNLPVKIPGEKNMLKDLAESFFFFDPATRKKSGFKIKSIDISLVHYLKDWTMNLTYSFKPEKKYNSVTRRTKYQFVPTISFTVFWKPIEDIKVKTKKTGEKFTVERSTLK